MRLQSPAGACFVLELLFIKHMKKNLVFLAGVLCLTISTHLAHAAGTFQLISPTTLSNAHTNVPYTATINFIYSGSYTPGVSLVSGSFYYLKWDTNFIRQLPNNFSFD